MGNTLIPIITTICPTICLILTGIVYDGEIFLDTTALPVRIKYCGEYFDPNFNNDMSNDMPHPNWYCLGWGDFPRYDGSSCKKAWTTCNSDDDKIIESRSDPKIMFVIYYVGRHSA